MSKEQQPLANPKNPALFERNPSSIMPHKLTLDSILKFRCHPGVSCFTACCGNINIILTPYDILRIRRVLNLPAAEFLLRFTTPVYLEKTDLPGVKLMLDEEGRCPFVSAEGCSIYAYRPTTCRYYPIGVGALSYSGEKKEKDEFFFTVKEAHCFGFEEDKEWTVAEWRQDQGIDLRDEVNEGWMDLMVRKKSLPPSMKLSEESKKIFFMVCYNIDKFRDFVFHSSFLDRYEIAADRLEEIRADDVKLLQFGFEWLKAAFFHAGRENFQVKAGKKA